MASGVISTVKSQLATYPTYSLVSSGHRFVILRSKRPIHSRNSLPQSGRSFIFSCWCLPEGKLPQQVCFFIFWSQTNELINIAIALFGCLPTDSHVQVTPLMLRGLTASLAPMLTEVCDALNIYFSTIIKHD